MDIRFTDTDGRLTKTLEYFKRISGMKTKVKTLEFIFNKALQNTVILDEEVEQINSDYTIANLNNRIDRQARINYAYSNILRSFYKQLSNKDVEIFDIQRTFKKHITDHQRSITGEVGKKLIKFKEQLTTVNLTKTRRSLIYLISKSELTFQKMQKQPVEMIEYQIKKMQQTEYVSKKQYQKLINNEEV